MKFWPGKRDGPARIGYLEIKKKKITTPNIVFIDTSRFKAPKFADITIANNSRDTEFPTIYFSEKNKNNTKEKNSDFICLVRPDEDYSIRKNNNLDEKTIFVISNAKQLFNKPKKFLHSIIMLREKIGYQNVIYLPSTGTPQDLSLLTYLGIDLFDSTPAIVAARNDIIFFENGCYDKYKIAEIPCNCPTCSNVDKTPKNLDFKEILNHNYFELIKEIRQIRNAISIGEIRNLVEIRVRSSPHNTAILKNLDQIYYEYLEKRAPITSKGRIIATTKESYLRPEIIRFQRRVIERYEKPNSAEILLLLPCSAKKPYSTSKSHKMFRDQILRTENPNVIHEVIITSPIGLVPRELEMVYPASSYDIPVTGNWELFEIEMISNLLFDYLKKNNYKKIISHLPDEIMKFLSPKYKNIEKSCKAHPTSQESLNCLGSTLKVNVKNYKKVSLKTRTFEEMRSIALYQFGAKLTLKLMENSTIKGKYPYRKIYKNNKQLGMTTPERGLISLTLTGAKILKGSEINFVEIYDDFKVIGSIFAPGVKDAAKTIRIGDEVIIKQKDEVIAVGVAQMNGEEMIESTHGEAVKVRHKS